MASIIRRTYKAVLPNGKTIIKKCDHWTIQYRDAAGKICRVKGYKDKAATKQLAGRIELALERGEMEMVSPHKASMARSISEHVAEYIADLTASGRDSEYAYIAERRINRIIAEAGWKTLKDITASSFIRWREAARNDPRPMGFRKEKGKATASARTLNQYLDTVRAFTNWCATTDRMPGIPTGSGKKSATALAGVGKVDGVARRLRRALSDDEVLALLGAVPADRALVYRFAVTTGLRRSELEALQWGDLRLASTQPYILLRAEATKSNRADKVPMPPALSVEMRKHRPAEATDKDKVFASVPSIEIWRDDLAAAKIDYLDATGHVADFHAGTRKTLCTRMHRNNVPLAIAMRVMRHTDSRLTLADYTDEEQLGISEVMNGMKELVAPRKAQKASVG
jgi:integrase